MQEYQYGRVFVIEKNSVKNYLNIKGEGITPFVWRDLEDHYAIYVSLLKIKNFINRLKIALNVLQISFLLYIVWGTFLDLDY